MLGFHTLATESVLQFSLRSPPPPPRWGEGICLFARVTISLWLTGLSYHVSLVAACSSCASRVRADVKGSHRIMRAFANGPLGIKALVGNLLIANAEVLLVMFSQNRMPGSFRLLFLPMYCLDHPLLQHAAWRERLPALPSR